MTQPLTAAIRYLSGEREPVRVATTENVTLQGLITLDDVELEVGDRVLVKDQTDQTQNGIYLASEGRWFRAPDASYTRAIDEGVTVAVQEGTAGNGRTYRFSSSHPIVGTDPITLTYYHSNSIAAEITEAAVAAITPIMEAAEAAKDAAEAAAGSVLFPVSYAPQTLSLAQQAQARLNINVSLPIGHIYGLRASNNASDPNSTVDVTAGECVSDDASPRLMKLATSISKSLGSVFAALPATGMLANGSKASNTTYHIFLIQRSDNGLVDLLASTSPTSPPMPTGYDLKRLIRSIQTDGSGNIIPDRQIGGFVRYSTPPSIWNGVAVTSTPQLLVTGVPVGRKLLAEIFAQITSGSASGYLSVCDPDDGNAAIEDAVLVFPATAAGPGGATFRVWTDTLGRVSVRSNINGTMGASFLRGYYDPRGSIGGGLVGI